MQMSGAVISDVIWPESFSMLMVTSTGADYQEGPVQPLMPMHGLAGDHNQTAVNVAI